MNTRYAEKMQRVRDPIRVYLTELCTISPGFLAYVGVPEKHSLSRRLRIRDVNVRVKVGLSINHDQVFLLRASRFHNETISKCNYKSRHDMSLFKFYAL